MSLTLKRRIKLTNQIWVRVRVRVGILGITHYAGVCSILTWCISAEHDDLPSSTLHVLQGSKVKGQRYSGWMHELSTHKQAAQASMSFTSACSAYQGSYVYKYIEHYAGMTCLNHMCPHITCPAVICFKACVSHYRDKAGKNICRIRDHHASTSWRHLYQILLTSLMKSPHLQNTEIPWNVWWLFTAHASVWKKLHL